MKIQGAVINEQGVTFAVVVVKKSVIDNQAEASAAIAAFSPVFPRIPLVLMAQDHRGIPTYYGRPDIAKFMSSVPMHVVPWKEYTLN